MEGRPLGFISNHCSENTLSSVGGGGMSGGGAGGVAIMMPSSPLKEPVDTSSSSNTALNLSTYTAGEDAGRLALMAKEFGLSRIRPQKRQIRRHTFMVNIFFVLVHIILILSNCNYTILPICSLMIYAHAFNS